MNAIFPLMTAACLALAGGSALGHPQGELSTIASVDLQRYSGRWYEVAKYPNWFQKKCVADTSADYSPQPDGTVQVLNQCRLADGQMQRAVGLARQTGQSSSPRLQVRFAPAWLSFLPLVWGDYWIVDLDERYELAAVSEPGRQYLWILSRTPQVDAARYNALLERLTGKGLDVSRLEKTAQAAEKR